MEVNMHALAAQTTHCDIAPDQLLATNQLKELQAQVALFAEQFKFLEARLAAAEMREASTEERAQRQALAKIQAKFALAASAEKTREKNGERFDKTFESFAAEMKANYDTLAQENRQLKAEILKAESNEAAARALHLAEQQANRKENLELKAKLSETNQRLILLEQVETDRKREELRKQEAEFQKAQAQAELQRRFAKKGIVIKK